MENENKLDWEKFKDLFHESWHRKMKPFIESPECYKIYEFLKSENARKKGYIIPKPDKVWRAFKETDLNNLKVVFMGLSPYPSRSAGGDIADGLAFSCGNPNSKIQPSLRLMFDAMRNDLEIEFEESKDLGYLAKDGVLLINCALTTELLKPESHIDVWKPFINYLFTQIFDTEGGLIFVFFGKEAAKWKAKTQPFMHYVKVVEHPAYAARQERALEHDHLFSWVNKLIKENKGPEYQVDWGNTLPF